MGLFILKRKMESLSWKRYTPIITREVQHERYMCNLPYCDFVVWIPKEFLPTRITIDTEFMTVITEKCFNLWRKAIVLELLCRTMDKSDDNQNGEKNFVFVKRHDENRSMVGCDNRDNWYHLDCLKLKYFPKVKEWYSKLCKSSKK